MSITISNKGSFNGLPSTGEKKSLTVKKPISFNIQSNNSVNTTQNKTWSNPFAGDNLPSYRDVLGRMTEVYEQDKDQGMMYASQFETLMHDESSPYYRRYSQPTNGAIAALQQYGFDTNNLNDEWFAQNAGWIRDNLVYNGQTNDPSNILKSKKYSDQQKVAYLLYQYNKSEATTKQAEKEYADALNEAQYWAWRSDRNMSDEEIIAKVRTDFSKKYPTLAKMEDKADMNPIELNRAVDFSDDALYGAIWMGRNSEFSGTLEQAMAYSALGRGVQYERNEEIAEKLNPESDKFDGGYSLGATNLDDAAFHFRVSGFDKKWLDEHNDIPVTGSEEDKKYYAQVVTAYNNQTQGREELDKLLAFVEKKVPYIDDPEEILKKINWSDYKILAAMDKSIGQNGNYATGDLVPLTEGLNYTYNGLKDYVTKLIDYKHQKQTCDAYISGMSAALQYSLPALAQQEYEAETEQKKTETNTMGHPDYRPSEQAIEIAKEKDRRLAESAEMSEGHATPSEQTVNENQRSSMYDYVVGVLNDLKTDAANKAMAFAGVISDATIGNYSTAVLTGFDTVQAYEQNEKQIKELQSTKDALSAELGDLIYAGREYKDNDVVPITVNGKVYDLHISGGNNEVYNEETDEFDKVPDYYPVRVTEHGNFDSPKEDITVSEEYQQVVQAAIDEANKGRTAWDAAQGAGLTEEQQAKIEQYWQASNALDNALKTRQDTEKDYDAAQKAIDDAKLTQEHRIELFKEAGLDTKGMEDAAAVTNFFLDFTKYDPTQWGSYNYYHAVSEMLMSGDATAEEVYKTAETGAAEIQQAIDVAQTMLEYADENGIQLPDNVRENVQRYIDSLQTQYQDFEYMSMIRNDDFEPGAAEGRRIADEMAIVDFDAFDAQLNAGQTYKEVLEGQPSWAILSEEQKEQLLAMADRADSVKESAMESGNPLPATYGMEEIQETLNAYLAELKIEDRMFGAFPFNVPMGEIMTDYEVNTYYYLLGTQGFEAAQEYSDHIALDNGVLNSRLRERTEENARNLADKGFWGSRAADVLSMLLSPIASAQSLGYTLSYAARRLSGERVEWNPDSADLSANIYKKAARDEIQKQIAERYKDNPILQKVMSGLQEIISNRGDSIVNGFVSGNFFDGIANQYLQEFLSAVPMGIAAATDAVSEAKENGASDTQLLGLYATTLLFEAGTEAVSLDNIRDSLNIGKELTTEGLKEWAVNWLTKTGISEMIGETVTEFAEQIADKALGDASNYEKEVRRYVEEDRMSEDEARRQADIDLVSNLLHTALISYLSPGMDIASYAAGRFSGYRSEAKYRQEHGKNDSIMDIYREFKQNREAAKEQANSDRIQAEVAEIEKNNSNEDMEAAEAQARANAEAAEAAEQARTEAERAEAEAEAAKQRLAQEMTLDIEILETATQGDASVQTASIAAVLNADRTQASFDVSNAAAANMNRLFGAEVTPSEGLQNLMLGAYVSDVSVADVKNAVQTAALSENSEAFKVMQTEEYQGADPGERAEMLAATVEADANNPAVQNDVAKAVHDNRVALAEKEVMDAPEVKAAHDKAYDAQGKVLAAQEATQQAQEQLDGYENELQAKRDALRTAGEEQMANASEAMRADMVNHAIAELQKANEVAEEYRMHLTKMQQNQAEAEEFADRTLEEYTNTKRTLAERLINEQDQQRAAEQEQADAEAAVQAEQEAQAAAVQEEVDNATMADAEAFIDQYERQNGIIPDEEKKRIRERFIAKQGTAQAQPSVDENGNLTTEAKNRRDKFVQQVSKKFNISVDYADTTEGGTKQKVNGYYDQENNRIVLDQNATMDDAMYFVLTHELTHVAENSQTYKQLANSLVRMAYGDNADFDTAIRNLTNNGGKPTSQLEADILHWKARYDSALGKEHSYEYAAQEMMGDYMGTVFFRADDEQRQDLVNRLVKDDPSVARRLLDSIKNFLKKAVGMKGAWLSNAQKTVDLLETSLKDAQKGKTATARLAAVEPNAPVANAQTAEQTTPKVEVPEHTIKMVNNRATVRFESDPSQQVITALRGIGMEQGKDWHGQQVWRAGKGVKIPEAQITWALKNAHSVVQQNTNDNGDQNNVKFSLREFEDGRRFVDVQADQKVFDGLSIDEMRAKARQIINKKYQNKVIGIDNPMFVNGVAVDEYAYPAKMVKDEQLMEAKLRAAPELDNVADAGVYDGHKEDGEDGHYHKNNVGGFDYYRSIFKVGDEYFDGKVNVSIVTKGRKFVDVTDLKNITQDIMSSYGENPKSHFLRDASMQSVAQEDNDVKMSLPSDTEFDQWFEQYISGLSAQELDELSQEMFGVSLNISETETSGTSEPENEQFATNVFDAYKSAIESGDLNAAQGIIDMIAKKAGYTVRGTHRTNADFTVFDRSKQTGKNGKSLGDGFYVAAGEGTEYDNDTYGKNRMLVYINPGNVFKIANGLTEEQANEVYDKYFAPYHNDEFNTYKPHVIGKLQSPSRVIDYIKEAAENDNTTTDEVFKWLGYDSIKDGSQYVVFKPEQIKSAEPITYDDNGNAIPISERFNDQKDDIRYSLPSDDILDQQIDEFLNRGGSLAQQPAPLKPNQGYRQWGNEGAQQSDELDAKAKAYVLNSPYAKDTNVAELARALEWVRGNKQFADDDGFRTSLEKVTSKRFNYRSKDGQARMVAVMALAVANGDINAQVELADAYNRQGTDLGQALQARKLFRLMTPEGRIASLRKMLGRVQEQTGNDDIRLSDWIYEAASQATDEGEFAKIQKAAAAELAEQMPGNWKDKLRGLRMLSMLGNPRTHIRNIIGNALFVPAVSLKNEIGALAEVITGQEERTKTLKLVLPKEIREFAKQDAEFMQDDLTGESKYNEGNLVQREQKPFKGFMQSLIDFNGNALEKEDWFFLKGHYQRALGGWIDANGYTIEQLKSDPALLDKGRAYAIQEAQKATYRDYNGLADKLNQLSRNPQTTGQKALGFITDAVLPFKKTPANILKRGIEYSPAGLIRGLKNAMLDVKSGKITATEAIDRICSGLAGTAILAMGAFLAHSGIVTCGLDDEDKGEKEQGNQKYSVKLHLFGEDVTYTMDWAAPMSMPFFVGAAIENQMRKEGDFDINELVNAMGNIAEPVFNLSMLDGVNTLFKTSQNDDTDAITQIGAKVVANYASSYVPSLLGAITRTADKRRATYVESGKGKGVTGTFRYAWEQVENKIPWLSQTNIAQRDVFGREETDALAERIIENFISPGYISHYKNDPILLEMDRLYNANVTDSEKMVPKDPPKSFKYNNTQYTLTAEQWDTFKTVRGQTAFDMLNSLIASADYQNADDAAQVQMINSVWEYATKVGKAAVVPDFNIGTQETVGSVTRSGKIASYNDGMLKSLENGDYVGYTTMVEGLHQMEVEDKDIKSKIRDAYRDKYKRAYIAGDQYKMAEIEQILDMTDFDFTDLIERWEEDVEKANGQ